MKNTKLKVFISASIFVFSLLNLGITISKDNTSGTITPQLIISQVKADNGESSKTLGWQAAICIATGKIYYTCKYDEDGNLCDKENESTSNC